MSRRTHRARIILAFSGILLLTGLPAAQAVMITGLPASPVEGERIPGVLIVNFKPGHLPALTKAVAGGAKTGILSVDALGAKFGLQSCRPLFVGADPSRAAPGAPDLRGYHVLDFDPGVNLDLAASAYLADPNVASVEYDFFAYIMRTPNDSQFGSMRNLNQANDRDIDAPEAWDHTAGSPNVVLADCDTGVLYTHEDLKDNIWVNPGEDLDGNGTVWDVGDLNGIDDDGNGFIDDLIGWDFVSGGINVWPGEDGGTPDNDPSDFNGHGTHTSGTIAATTNNTVGVSGIAGGFGPGVEDGCKIMCLRQGYSFVDDNGFENGVTHMSIVAAAFRYAADNGAVAINYSFGSSGGGGIEGATDYAIAAGIVISAAAGNDNSSFMGYLQSRDDVLNVASVTNLDVKSGFSNYGALVDVSAPGSSIRSTVSNHYTPSYAIYSGTSMAAPHVVGLVGLIKSLNPLLTGPEIFDRIKNTTDTIDHLNPSYAGLLGTGRINANKALSNIASTSFGAAPILGEAPLTVSFFDSSATVPTAWTWDFGDGDTAFVQNPSHAFGPGLFDVSLHTQTTIGDGFHLRTNFITAYAETLFVDSIEAEQGSRVAITITAVNYLPLTGIVLPINATNVSPSGSALMDSIVTTGCRTAYFESQSIVFNNMFFGQAAIQLGADAGGGALPLAPGSGPIAKVWFTVSQSALPANPVVISSDTVGGMFAPEFTTLSATVNPFAHGGRITFAALVGDMNFDRVYDVLDVVALVNVVFRNGAPPDPAFVADVNCDGTLNVLDVVGLVGTVFRSGAAPDCP